MEDERKVKNRCLLWTNADVIHWLEDIDLQVLQMYICNSMIIKSLNFVYKYKIDFVYKYKIMSSMFPTKMKSIIFVTFTSMVSPFVIFN